MTSPIEVTEGVCLYGACPDFQEFDAGRGHVTVEDGVELSFPSDEGAQTLNECLAVAGCYLANAKENA